MGTTAEGTVTVGGRKVNVKADFASDHVTFSGGRRGEVKYTAVEVLGTAKGVLRLRVDGAPMDFPLGDKVDRIANKIRRPPSILDKLGVKEGLLLAVEGTPAWFLPQAREAGFAVGLPARPVDLLVVGANDPEGLAFEDWRGRIHPDGCVWVVYPKNRHGFREGDVLAAGRAAGLKDVKVARFSETHSALKFVVPLAER